MYTRYRDFLLLESNGDLVRNYERLKFILNDRPDKSDQARKLPTKDVWRVCWVNPGFGETNKIFEYFESLRKKFHTTVLDLWDSFPTFYSSLASDKNADPVSDFKRMNSFMSSNFSLSVVKILFSPEVNFILGDEDFSSFIRSRDSKYGRRPLIELSGYIDLYLFELNKRLNLDTTVFLGGNMGYDLSNHEETIIKYAYGYHKTKYGKMLFDQLGISVSDFVAAAYSNLKTELNSNVFSRLCRYLEVNFEVENWSSTLADAINSEKYVVLDDDRFIIEYGDMLNDIGKFVGPSFDKRTRSGSSHRERIRSVFEKELLGFFRSNLEIHDTGSSIIIDDV